VISLKSVTKLKAKRWLWFVLAAFAAIQLYYVQEMLAALLLFSVLFIVAAIVALILFLVDLAGESALAWAEPRVVQASKSARLWPRLEEASRRLLHRLRSETAR
jgi:fatty acid desaturase